MGLKEKLIKFMYGRNGNDQLSFAVFIGYIILTIVNTFVRSSVLNFLIMLLPAYAIFRMLSKNIYKRREENEKFLKIWYKILPKVNMMISHFKQRKTRVFRKCPSCQKMLRLPRKKGKHTVICPICKHKFKLKILF